MGSHGFRAVLSILLLVFVDCCCAQTWQAINPPVNIFNGVIYATNIDSSGNIYAAGDFRNSSYKNFVATWNGTDWKELGGGSSALNANGTILTLASRGDTIYAAGAFTNQYYQNYVAKWNGTSWSELDTDTSLHANGFIYSIAVDKAGNVYAAGGFTNAAGEYYVAKWNGTSWSELGSGANALNANNAIFAIAVDASGNVYAGGYFTDASGKEYVAKWDGTSWSELGAGPHALNANDFVSCIATDSKGNVYAGGDFRNSNNEYYLAKWNGTTWTETGSGDNALHANDAINSIAVNSSNDIYVAGIFTNDGNYYVAKWNGASWSQVNNSQSPLIANDHIQSVTVDAHNNIYAGGKFLNKSGHSFVAEWNDATWKEIGSKGDPFYTSQIIYQITADSAGRNVYVSGGFTDNGGRNYLEHWDSGGWHYLQIPDSANLSIYLQNTGAFGESHQMAVDKKGNLYVTGRRMISFDNGYDCILKWDGKQWSILEDFANSLKTTNDNAVYGIPEIEMDPKGNIYAAGSFNDPVYGECSLAKWDGKTWSRLPGSYADYIQNFCVSGDGNIYAYGGFINAFGRAIIANYNPAKHFNWEEVKDGSNELSAAGFNVFMTLTTDSKNNLYVNGDFADSVGNRYVARWNEKTWSEFGVTNKLGWALEIDQHDNIYTSSGINFGGGNGVQKWNGTSWIDIGVPLTNVIPDGLVLATDALGNVYTDAFSPESGVGAYIAKYAVTAFAPPKLSSFAPARGSVGTKVTITGQNLTGTASVSFGGTQAASFIVQNDSTLTAVVANGSTGSILIATPGGADSLKTFTYTCDSVKGPVPYISLMHDSILVSSNANYYQWFYNNHQLKNANSNSLLITGAGFYHIATSEDKVCWIPSLDYPVLISQNPLSDSLKMSIYPNPSSGQFTVDVKLPQTTTVKAYVKVFDVNGLQVLQTSKLIFYGNGIRIPVTINSKGTFFVKIFVNDDAVQQSVIIM